MSAPTPDNQRPDQVPDPVAVVLPLLSTGQDVIRCAAARALAALGQAHAAPDLIEALLDEDPDVRADAMSALVNCARPEDADAILRSLEGDPVKEVKTLAIDALARLGATSAIPILSRLAVDRAEDVVAWEDEAGMWDDWLDIQNAAIEALGTLGAADAIPALLAARTDEMGQDIDHLLFAALPRMSTTGVSTLIDIVTDSEGRLRARALAALEAAPGECMLPLVEPLAADASADVRCIAILYLDAQSDLASTLALEDPDAIVRRKAVETFAPHTQEIAKAALSDPDEIVRARALGALTLDDDVADALANAEAWLSFSGPHLAVACIRFMERAGGAECTETVTAYAADEDHLIETRIAAVGTIGRVAEKATETLHDFLSDPAQQIRAAALAALAARAPNDPEALAVLVDTIRQATTAPDEIEPDENDKAEGDTAVASRVETAPPRLHITPDGDVVELDETGDAETPDNVVPFPTSTLTSIGAWKQEEPPATDDANAESTDPDQPDDAPPKAKSARRRVPVDGPRDVRVDLPLVAVRVAGTLADAAVEDALLEATKASNAELSAAVFQALAARADAGLLSVGALDALLDGLQSEDGRVRGFAATALMASSLPPELVAESLHANLTDPDTIVRAAAVKAVGYVEPAAIDAHIEDISPIVRLAVMTSVASSGDLPRMNGALDGALRAQATDTIAAAANQFASIRNLVIDRLSKPDSNARNQLILLDAIAASKDANTSTV